MFSGSILKLIDVSGVPLKGDTSGADLHVRIDGKTLSAAPWSSPALFENVPSMREEMALQALLGLDPALPHGWIRWDGVLLWRCLNPMANTQCGVVAIVPRGKGVALVKSAPKPMLAALKKDVIEWSSEAQALEAAKAEPDWIDAPAELADAHARRTIEVTVKYVLPALVGSYSKPTDIAAPSSQRLQVERDSVTGITQALARTIGRHKVEGWRAALARGCRAGFIEAQAAGLIAGHSYSEMQRSGSGDFVLEIVKLIEP